MATLIASSGLADEVEKTDEEQAKIDERSRAQETSHTDERTEIHKVPLDELQEYPETPTSIQVLNHLSPLSEKTLERYGVPSNFERDGSL